LSQDVLFKVFQCDMDAVLDTHSGVHDGTCCGHTNHVGACCNEEHSHSSPLAPVRK
jgi:hypothetical protein